MIIGVETATTDEMSATTTEKREKDTGERMIGEGVGIPLRVGGGITPAVKTGSTEIESGSTTDDITTQTGTGADSIIN